MKKLLIVFCLIFIAACKGDKQPESVWDLISNYKQLPNATSYRIMGEVKCPSCLPDDIMTVYFGDPTEFGTYDIRDGSKREKFFGNGQFVVDINLVPEQKLMLYLQVGITPYEQEIAVPKDTTEAIHVIITLP
ncbi:MAG: hypothetical protein HYY43_00400 [Deltaproteobacteria bacterium]|nr:hypothetical protein [Deltaproteobacteria bacterium]MBI2974048.1 hypothetical protein [Deltaproteobacteria bacterium]